MSARNIIVERRRPGLVPVRHVFVIGEKQLAVPLLGTNVREKNQILAYLLFDGEHLEVSAALADVPVTIDGDRVGGRWTRVPLPSALEAGGEQFDVRVELPRPETWSATRGMRARLTTLPSARGIEYDPTVAMTGCELDAHLETAPQTTRSAQMPTAQVPCTPMPRTQMPTEPGRLRLRELRERLPTRRKLWLSAITVAVTTVLLVLGAPRTDALPQLQSAMAKGATPHVAPPIATQSTGFATATTAAS
ncbi:MAG: hypothetical protein JWP87_777, partial [Labilithrix sp.]|nr:hypothetical protein [Labilithrix sp.]